MRQPAPHIGPPGPARQALDDLQHSPAPAGAPAHQEARWVARPVLRAQQTCEVAQFEKMTRGAKTSASASCSTTSSSQALRQLDWSRQALRRSPAPPPPAGRGVDGPAAHRDATRVRVAGEGAAQELLLTTHIRRPEPGGGRGSGRPSRGPGRQGLLQPRTPLALLGGPQRPDRKPTWLRGPAAERRPWRPRPVALAGDLRGQAPEVVHETRSSRSNCSRRQPSCCRFRGAEGRSWRRGRCRGEESWGWRYAPQVAKAATTAWEPLWPPGRCTISRPEDPRLRAWLPPPSMP